MQRQLGSGINAKSTADEVVKGIGLTRKIAVVAGGSTGINLETTKVLGAAGATLEALGLLISQSNYL